VALWGAGSACGSPDAGRGANGARLPSVRMHTTKFGLGSVSAARGAPLLGWSTLVWRVVWAQV
jgi:hypothetical protein